MTLLTLSDVHVLGAKNVHPDSIRIETGVEQFSQRYGLKSQGYLDYSTMSLYLFPDSQTPRLTAINMLMNILFYIDDELNIEDMRTEDLSGRELFLACLTTFCTGKLSMSHPFVEPWCELNEHFLKVSDQQTINRIVENLSHYLTVSTLSMESICVDGVVDLDRFVQLRLLASGMFACISTIEFAQGIYLPDYFLSHPVIAQMRYDCAFYGAILNDIFSFHKEWVAGNHFNLIALLIDTQGFSLEEAVHQAVTMLNEKASEFIALESQVPQSDNDSENIMLRKYIKGMHDHFVASWHWQFSTNRYRSPESPFPQLREMLAPESVTHG